MNKTNDFKYNLPAYSDPVDIEDLNDNFRGIDDALMAGLCKKDYTGNNMGSSDPSARKYAWAPWLEIVNDNEFDVVVADRNAPVESEEATINIAAGQTFRKYINGRYYMNFYVQDQHDVTFKWFTNAETYINESGGGGGGTGTVTSVSVQGGSGSHLTASGNPIETLGTITIDIDDGYSIPSDNEQTAWDGKAADLKLEINSSTYVITAQLKDSSGNLIGNERTIDLPLESVVVSGTYDDQTKKVILTLQNGSTIEFSVADLVSGLQTELSASNKLDPDYIDYDSNHRAVSDTEKNTWNAKQNAIDSDHKLSSDLVDDTNHTNKFVTSTEKNTWNGKQNAIDSEHKLSSSLVSFTTAEAAAIASGIDSSKVGQISTNQTNILYALETGAANYAPLEGDNRSGSGYFLDATNSGMKVFTSGTVMHVYCEYTKTTNTQFSIQFTNASGNVIASTSLYAPSASASGTISGDVTLSQDVYGYNAYYNGASGNTCTITNVMICPKNVWDAIQKYVPYSVPNSDLTYLEAEDRAALAEEIDAGAKNKLSAQLTSNTGGHKEATWTFMTDCVGATVNGTVGVTWDDAYVFDKELTFNDQEYILVIQTSNNNLIATLFGNTSPDAPSDGQYTAGVYRFKGKITTTSRLSAKSGTYSNATIKLMICTKAAFGISPKFVPYVPPVVREAIDITSAITTSTGYSMINSLSHLYKMGNNVFGELIFQKSSGNFSTDQSNVAIINPQYAPIVQFIGVGGFSTTEWAIETIGYVFVQVKTAAGGEAGKIMVRDTVTTNNYVHVSLNYVT